MSVIQSECYVLYFVQFYQAVVEAITPELPTCIVTFSDYGNSEEVNLCDVKPVPKHMVSHKIIHKSRIKI